MANVNDWDEVVFNDLSEMELFWFTSELSYDNHAYRKLNMDGNVINTKTREETTISPKTKVFVRS